MAGYTRQSSFADGDTITAALFNDEYNQLVNAFNNSTGHSHDGTAASGPVIGLIGDAGETSPNNKVLIDTTNNYIEFYIEVSSAPVQQLYIADGAIVPVTDNDIDLGTSSLEFKNLYLDGTAKIDTLTVDEAATIGTTLGVTGATTLSSTLGVTGATTLSSTLAVTGATTLSSTLAVTGTSTLTGNVTTTNNLSVGGNLTVTGNATISGNLTFGDADTDTITIGADVASNITPDVDDTYDLGTSTKEWRNLYIDGTANIDSLVADTADINAGTIDNTVIGGTTAVAGSFTTATATTGNITTVNATTVDTTNIEVTNLKAKDGTSAGSIADSTGVVTLASSVLTTTDINGGTIDNTAIGGTTASTGAFTTLTASGATTLNGNVTLGDAATDNVVFNADVNSSIIPNTDDTYDLGSVSQEWRNLYIDGTANIDSLVADTADINGGTIDGVTIGGTTAGAVTFTDLSDGTITIAGFVDEDTMVSDSATLVPTQQSVKAYVDSQVTAQDLDFQGDTGGALSIDLDSETLTIAGGTGIDTSGATNTLTVSIDSTVATLTGTQTLTNKTLTTPVIGSIVNTGTLTLPTSTDTLVGRATTDTLTNKTLTSPVINTSVSGTAFLDDDTFATATATTLASSESIKAYVDAQVATANELSELTDVNITTPADGAMLFYDTATSKWIDNVVSGDIVIADTGVATIQPNSVALGTDTTGDYVGTITAGTGLTSTGATTGEGIAHSLSVNASQTQITAVGTLSSLTVSGDLTVDTNTLFVDSTNNRVGILDATPAVTLDIGSATDAVHVPVGTTAQRPTASAGMFRYNTTLSQFEGYTTEWGAIGGGGTNTFTRDAFTGDGTTTAFTLSQAIDDENDLLVFNGGVFQNQDAYIVSGTTLTFDTAPANGNTLIVYSVKAAVSGNNLNQDSFSGDGTTTAFTLSINPVNENNTQVFIDGVYQQKDAYSTSGTTLTFTAAPPNGTTIEVMTFTQTEINVPVDGTITPAKIASGDFYFDTNTLYIDATNNRVGIGSTIPATALDVTGTVTADGLTVDSTTGFSWLPVSTAGVQLGTIGTGTGLIINTPSVNSSFGSGLAIDGSYASDLSSVNIKAFGAKFASYGSELNLFTSDDTSLLKRQSIASNGDISFYDDTGVSQALFWDASAESLGIGTTSPAEKLHVAGAIATTAGISGHGANRATFSQEGANGAFIQSYGANTSTMGAYTFRQASSDFSVTNIPLAIDSSGNVGIGTNNPGVALQVHDSLGTTLDDGVLRLIDDTSYAQNVGAAIALGFKYNSSGNVLQRGGVIKAIKENATDGNYASALLFGTTANGASTTERMRINSSGEVLINCTSNSQGSDEGTKFVSNGRMFQVSTYSTSAQESLHMYSSGASAARFYVDWGGTIHATSTSISAISDQRLKENIVDLETGLTEVMALKPRRFDWKNGDKTNVAGFIAQEVETVLPDLIDGFKDNTIEDAKGVRMGDMIPTLVKAIQELSNTVDNQQTIIEDLKTRIETLENN